MVASLKEGVSLGVLRLYTDWGERLITIPRLTDFINLTYVFDSQDLKHSLSGVNLTESISQLYPMHLINHTSSGLPYYSINYVHGLTSMYNWLTLKTEMEIKYKYNIIK